MKIVVVKRIIFLLVFLFGYSAVNATDADLITKQITIKLDKAGTLSDRIGYNKMYKITNLKIIGEINGADWCHIKNMAGYRNDEGKLSVLDLSEVKIVGGADSYPGNYYNGSDHSYYFNYDDRLGDYAFEGCGGLTSLKIPSNVTSIGGHAFEGCSGLTSLEFPSCVTSIGSYAFEGCGGLTSLKIPSNVTSIGEGAFKKCSGLTSLTLESPIKSIEKSTFEGCTSLTNLAIYSWVSSIGARAFYGCISLTSFTTPYFVTSIGESAFCDCTGLTSFTIRDNVVSIGRSAFWNCRKLVNLSIPSTVTFIDDFAFYGCSGLKNVQYQISDDIETYLSKNHPYIGVECGIEYYLNKKKITSVVIPSTITELGKYVFQRCKDFTSVYVNRAVPISAYNAFKDADISNTTLYVPQGTYQDYWLTDVWGDFGNIVEYDVTGIDKVTDTNDAKEVSRYSVNGQRLSAPTKGLNIVKYSDGSVRKEMVT